MPDAHRIATVVAALSGTGIVGFGARFLATPDAAARDYGVTPPVDDDPYLAVTGVRDIGVGLVALTLLATGQRRALGWALLATAAIPVGDAAIVLRNGGSRATAYGIHATSAAVLAAAGAVLARGRDRSTETSAR